MQNRRIPLVARDPFQSVRDAYDRKRSRRVMPTVAMAIGLMIGPLLHAEDAATEIVFPGKVSQWHGFDRHDFELNGKPILIVAPNKAVEGNPWVWHGEFFGHKPAPDIELLKKGFHIVYTRVPNLLGAPIAVEHWDQVYDELTSKYELADKVALVGLSRGGLYCYNWAAKNPEKVACIYGDAPVCDFKSWPGGQGVGKGSQRDWDLVIKEYGFSSDTEANTYKGNPVDTLSKLVSQDVPLLHVYGDADEVVPWDENTGLIADRYRELGGRINLIQKPGVGHHPHGLSDPMPIVNFIVKHCLSSDPVSIKKKKLDPVDQVAIQLEPSRQIVYKTIDENASDGERIRRELYLHVFQPEDWSAGQRLPCFVVIHGGGWTGGEPRRMYPFASHFADLGMVGISVQYRLMSSKRGATVFDSVSDVRSAIRFIKSNSDDLGIDANRLVISGGSAGGHLAAATAMFSEVNDPADDLGVDPKPNALVLLFPVIDTSEEGYGQRKIGVDWAQLSPLHRVVKGIPPTLIFHGTGDTVTPYAGAAAFATSMREKGNSCELVSHDGGRHGYLMFDQSLFEETLAKMEEYFAKHQLLPEGK